MKNFFKGLGKAVVAVLVVALLVVGGLKLVKEKRAKEASQPVAKIYPIVVSTITPSRSQVRLTLPYLAQSVNERDVTISARLSSRVEMIKKSGESVKKGDIVVKLDTTDLNAKMASLQVSLENLESSHRRTKALYKAKGASIEQLQKEQTQIASLKANIKSLHNQLSYATIKAPISGVITKSFSADGDVAMPGKPLIKISAKNGFSLIVRTPEDINPKAIIYKGKEYPIVALGSTFNGLKEYKSFVDTSGLTAGDRVEISVIVFEGEGIKLPFDAILNQNGKSFVMRVEKGMAIPQEVEILDSAKEGVLVSNAIEGEKIVVAKPDILLKLTSGYAIRVKE